MKSVLGLGFTLGVAVFGLCGSNSYADAPKHIKLPYRITCEYSNKAVGGGSEIHTLYTRLEFITDLSELSVSGHTVWSMESTDAPYPDEVAGDESWADITMHM